MALHDYTCSACGESFSVGDPRDDTPVVCPACGSSLVRELWESRLRNSPGPPKPIEELRDCVG